MSTPEELTRTNIDKQLKTCNWSVQSLSDVDLYAARGMVAQKVPYWED